MILFKKAADLRNYLALSVKKGESVGFVPSMGALHEGHSSLIRYSISENPLTICSIFVNPTQFNDPRDFEKYPHTLEKDINLLESLGCRVVFIPTVNEIYPEGTGRKKDYDLGPLETMLEGKFRPGHFQGVCMVMQRLLEIVRPDRLYMGQKDYQQCLVIKRLISIIGMQDLVRLIIAPTLRASDGLALSSRNTRLNYESRKKANSIHLALSGIKRELATKDFNTLIGKARQELESSGFKVDYVEIRGANELEEIGQWDGKQKLVAVAAAFLQEVRLIDNLLLN